MHGFAAYVLLLSLSISGSDYWFFDDFFRKIESDEKWILMVKWGSRSKDTLNKSEKRPLEGKKGEIYGGKKTIYWKFRLLEKFRCTFLDHFGHETDVEWTKLGLKNTHRRRILRWFRIWCQKCRIPKKTTCFGHFTFWHFSKNSIVHDFWGRRQRR